jgi:hypothetical protein
MINKDKTTAMFSPNTSEYIKNQMLTELSIVQIVQNDKYLGLLVFIGKSKKRAFE